MRFVLLLKSEFIDRTQEIAEKYSVMGVSDIVSLKTAGIIVGESNLLTFNQLMDNDWALHIRKERKVQGYQE